MASTLPETKEQSLARFNQKWRADGECWAWTGALTNGYGSFRINGRSYGAHQAAFLLLKGALPTCIDHLCRNRACVNPSHLEAVSNRENVLRGVGVTAINSKKTHCPKGHELTVDNTLIKRLPTGTTIERVALVTTNTSGAEKRERQRRGE